MVSTRSQTAQTHLEDSAAEPQSTSTKSPSKPTPEANTSRKRKHTNTELSGKTPFPKRTKTLPENPTEPRNKSASVDKASKAIIINRAPVLHLWAASVTHLIYPKLSWETCLSAGAAVSSICAVAKGRAIGAVPENQDSEAKYQKREQAKVQQKKVDEIEVMQFKLEIKDGLAVVGSESKGKAGGEEALKRKFGDDEYERVKGVFGDSLQTWVGEEEELNRRGFSMYEAFRPDVRKGQKGWGRKGELGLERVANVIGKND
ncbi:hypothetical protein SVAN01_03282 [Stagonosporopsis vannaccii]|nr:hypothetical protein SVAN01_03282 [Stagonosporopsis vannaccii]